MKLYFNSDNNESYNKTFAIEVLIDAISKTKCTTPGPDEIHIPLLKNLPRTGTHMLLLALNKIWTDEFFILEWWQSTILPIPKPKKCPTNPSNYQPIALTSVLCEIMEKIVSLRLMYFFEIKNALSPFQCGGRPQRAMTDQLISLESTKKKVQANDEHIVSIFLIWRKHMTLHEKWINQRPLRRQLERKTI